MYLELQGHGFTSETLSHALKALQTQHPFLRMGIEYQENVATLIELPSSGLIPSAKAGLHPKWQARLQDLANEFKDLAEGVMSVDFGSDGEQHQLFLTLNHAGNSAPQFCHKNPSMVSSVDLLWSGGSLQCMRRRCNNTLFLQEVTPLPFHIYVMPCSSISAKPVRTKAYPLNQSASCTIFTTTWKPGCLWTSASGLSLPSQLLTCRLCLQTECKRLLSLTWLQYGLSLMPIGPRHSFPGVVQSANYLSLPHIKMQCWASLPVRLGRSCNQASH